jgi:hypothetical protein
VTKVEALLFACVGVFVDLGAAFDFIVSDVEVFAFPGRALEAAFADLNVLEAGVAALLSCGFMVFEVDVGALAGLWVLHH